MRRSLLRSPAEASFTLRIGTAQQFRWLHGVVKALLLLNLCDVLFTLLWIYSGLAHEANPLLAEIVIGHPVAFSCSKLALVGLGSILLWRYRDRPLAVIAIFVGFLAYYFVLLWHIRFLGLLLGAWLVP
jgi:Domain of unknown function (DUF5658)